MSNKTKLQSGLGRTIDLTPNYAGIFEATVSAIVSDADRVVRALEVLDFSRCPHTVERSYFNAVQAGKVDTLSKVNALVWSMTTALLSATSSVEIKHIREECITALTKINEAFSKESEKL